ncbi:hypothetical protein BP5796_03569 [Coleophoma crateriformis]|uniref:Uncharacterized protein n=1 Tax=Coleophoma crateriformis TaxID=565419 RepID=A0A3D8SNH3_9HELO|nr:hypothetical protein BP5796_03569 [Coleophoma crateriformis]
MSSLELGLPEKQATVAVSSNALTGEVVHITVAKPVRESGGILATLRYYEQYLDWKMGVEPHGPERITPDQKKLVPIWVMACIWSSGTFSLSSITLGMYGWEYGLSLTQSVLAMLFGSLLGAFVAGWCSTFGSATGLRQVSVARYSFGWWPAKLIGLLNLVSQVGWAAVGCITGGNALSAASDYNVSLILGVVIIAVVSLVGSFGGYRSILMFDRYWWMPFAVIFLIYFGYVGSYQDKGYRAPATISGITKSGAILDFFAIYYGNSASWATIAADYYVHYPVETSRVKIFTLTTLGIWLPIFVTSLLGALLAAEMNVRPEWSDAYHNEGVGALLLLVVHPLPWAKCLLVLISLGGIGLNVLSIYSGALAMQQLAKPLQAVPRFVWSLVLFAFMLALSLGGRNHIYDFLSNMLSLLGYYDTCMFVIIFIEHYGFRGGNFANYDLEAWNTPSKLPIGFAGGFAFLCGWVGAILGMDETFYIGVLATKIGAYGGDIGNQLAFVFTVVSFYPLRWLELTCVGR